MRILVFFATLLLIGCGAEWGGGEVGRVSCSFDDFLPNAGRAIKMAMESNGNELYILDDFSYVYSYKRDNLYECAFDLENTYRFNGFPKDGFFAVGGGELAVGGKSGVEIWDISNCAKTRSIASQSVLALVLIHFHSALKRRGKGECVLIMAHFLHVTLILLKIP